MPKAKSVVRTGLQVGIIGTAASLALGLIVKSFAKK